MRCGAGKFLDGGVLTAEQFFPEFDRVVMNGLGIVIVLDKTRGE